MPAARKTSSIRHKLALPEVKVAPLPPLPAQLPDDVEALKALLRAQQAAHQQAIEQSVQQALEQAHEHAMRHIDHLYEQFVLLRQRHFGASTEQSSGQAHLFDEAEVLAAASTPDQDQVPLPSQGDAAADAGKKAAGKPARGKRAPLPAKPMAGVQIAQKDLAFNPAVTVVTVGTPVLFPNQDTVKHHVYSYSAAKTFQIKLYAGVPHTPIVFDKPGVAVLGCNIHDSMIAWVVVTDTPLWARSAASGAARVLDVPPGNYQMHVWHASLAETTPPQLLPLTVAAGDVEQRVKLAAGGLVK